MGSKPSYDPNFPPNLNIAPLLPTAFERADQANGPAATDEWDQTVGIQRYGIAGRVWDASYPLLPYLTRPTASSTLEFDPVCSLFRDESDPRGITLLELGSGQSLASLHLALQLATTDVIVLTDLPEVMTLCEKNASEKLKGHQAAQVLAQGLAWGDEESVALLAESVEGRGGLTHVLLCDLIYFPHLYPLLLRTLLQVTSEPFSGPRAESNTDETFGPELIISYKSRTLALEESFFQALSLYFHVAPVLSRSRSADANWRLHGEEHDTHLFIARRWNVEREWTIPPIDRIMAPESAKGVKNTRGGWGLIEGMFAGLEWD